MAKLVTENVGRFNQHYPASAVVVTAQANGKRNAMAVAWHCSISFKPPLYGISIAAKRYTYQLIAASKEFAINFMPLEAAELIASLGGSAGKDTDKFQRFNITTDRSLKTGAPILSAAYAAYECKLVDDKGYGDHRWLVGEVVAVHTRDKAFTAEEVLDLSQVSPALFMGRELYATTDKSKISKFDREVYGKR
jgi:flavin reductase (DIM6/NTAB) family NADH-FMN oxidoreductase RutF